MKRARALALIAVLACAKRADAQGRAAASADPASPPDPTSVESRLSMAVAERLLASDKLDDQLRAIERLASWGHRESIDRILRVLDAGTPLSRDPRLRLTAVRALRPFVAREPVFKLLAKTASEEPDLAPLAVLVQQTAAMALAASQDARAAGALFDALEQSASAARAAESALLAYPPPSLAEIAKRPQLRARSCRVLGSLGDVRAIGLLRSALARASSAGRATDSVDSRASSADERRATRVAAAEALAELGDEEQVPVARSWVASDDAELRLSGVEILLTSRTKDAAHELASLLRVPELRSRAVPLTRRVRDRELAPVLFEIARLPDPAADQATVSLGRLDDGAGVPALERLLRDPQRQWSAAYALALSSAPSAGRALESALADPALRRLAARAGAVRAITTGAPPRGLVDQLEALRRGADPSDRAAGSYGLALLGRFPATELETSRDAAVVRAVARAARLRGGELARACSARLARETDATTRQSLAIVLAGGSRWAAPISTIDLSTWADSDAPDARLAVFALGAREEAGREERMNAFLASDDPITRAHAAWGLAESASPTVSARLARALRFEGEPSVRRALVEALSVRAEPQKWEALRATAALDPDPRARGLARRALWGPGRTPPGTLGAGCAGGAIAAAPCATAWIRLVPPERDLPLHPAANGVAADFGGAGGRSAMLRDASGLVLPVVSDPDGALLVVGVSPGAGSFDLASSALWDDALQDDTARPARGGRTP
jgi:HEAT repeat protein